MNNPSIEFLIHYPPCSKQTCQYTWNSGDRYPLKNWHCPKCGYFNSATKITTHYSLLESRTDDFRKLIKKLSNSTETTID